MDQVHILVASYYLEHSMKVAHREPRFPHLQGGAKNISCTGLRLYENWHMGNHSAWFMASTTLTYYQ